MDLMGCSTSRSDVQTTAVWTFTLTRTEIYMAQSTININTIALSESS